jgi:hypothetical protein
LGASHVTFFDQRGVSCRISMGIRSLRFITKQLGASLLDERYVWAGVDLEEYLARLYWLSFRERHPIQQTVHLCFDGDGLHRFRDAVRGDDVGDTGSLDCRHAHRNARLVGRVGLRACRNDARRERNSA